MPDAISLRAALELRGGQCGRCSRAVWGERGRVVGCELAENGGELSTILAALLFQLAQAKGARPCVARELVPLEPDAYLSEDQPIPPAGT